ncbi:MAG TPA: LysR family transcriptional regulator [Vineibacter sp.]|nr:LysR family transcriptional regulator [Vineibacter sp.]
MDRLTAMAVFRKVVERGSFTVAAEHLSMSNASVSKYVASLETHIGTPLLTRTTRRVSLTEAGRSYYAKCTRILDEIEEAETSTGQLQTTPRGLLKVRAPVSLGAARFGRTVADFLARFPDVTIEMTLNDRFTDPADEGFDVALLISGKVTGLTRATQPIARMARALVAAPAYLAQHGMPTSVPSLKRHNCIIYSRGHAPDEWRFSGASGERVVRVSGNCRCNNAMLLREALLEGAGIGLLPSFLVAGDIANGNLRMPLPAWVPESRTIYAVFPQQHHPSAKVRAFVSFLAHSFAADSQWQIAPREGREPFTNLLTPAA